MIRLPSPIGAGDPHPGVTAAWPVVTGADGVGHDDGPLAGHVFDRSVGDSARSWADGVSVTMAGCSSPRASVLDVGDCAAADSRGGWAENGAVTVPDRDSGTDCVKGASCCRSFRPFEVSACVRGRREDRDRLEAQARAIIAAGSARLIGWEAQTGAESGSPSLAREASVVDTPEPLSPARGVAALLWAWENAGALGAPNIFGSHAAIASTLTETGAADLGAPLIAGIPGTAPTATPTPAGPASDATPPATADDQWLYLAGEGFVAVGPTETRRPSGDSLTGADSDTFDYRTNRVVIEVARPVMAVFHTCGVFAVRVRL